MSDQELSVHRYVLDAGQSRFTVQAFATGLLAGFGHSPTFGILDFRGEAQFVPETLADATLVVEVDAGSIRLLDQVKDKDRREIQQTMFDRVLEINRYPGVVFRSTQIAVTRVAENRYKARVTGDLTLHGVTRAGLWIPAQVTVDGDALRAQGDFTLNQSDYNIKPVRVAAGALKLKDELRFRFDLIGHRE